MHKTTEIFIKWRNDRGTQANRFSQTVLPQEYNSSVFNALSFI